jgi:hypothetical protein
MHKNTHTHAYTHTYQQTEQAQWLSTLLGELPISSGHSLRSTLRPPPLALALDRSPTPCVLTYPPSTFPSPSMRCASPSFPSRCASPSLRSLHPSGFWRSPSPIDESPLFPSTYNSQNTCNSDIHFTPSRARAPSMGLSHVDAAAMPMLTLQLSRRINHHTSAMSPGECPPPPSSTPMPGYECESRRVRDVLDSSVWDFQVM